MAVEIKQDPKQSVKNGECLSMHLHISVDIWLDEPSHKQYWSQTNANSNAYRTAASHNYVCRPGICTNRFPMPHSIMPPTDKKEGCRATFFLPTVLDFCPRGAGNLQPVNRLCYRYRKVFDSTAGRSMVLMMTVSVFWQGTRDWKSWIGGEEN
jgi:hypothetical protein